MNFPITLTITDPETNKILAEYKNIAKFVNKGRVSIGFQLTFTDGTAMFVEIPKNAIVDFH